MLNNVHVNFPFTITPHTYKYWLLFLFLVLLTWQSFRKHSDGLVITYIFRIDGVPCSNLNTAIDTKKVDW